MHCARGATTFPARFALQMGELMRAVPIRLSPQPLVAVLLTVLAAAAMFQAARFTTFPPLRADYLLLAAGLSAAVVASYQFPIHLGRGQKVDLTSVPLFLIAVLSPNMVVGAATAAAGVLFGELLVKGGRGNLYSDVLTATSRWTIVVLIGSTFSQLAGNLSIVALLGTAFIMWVGDNITCPLVVGPMTGERPLRLMNASFHSATIIEGTQYLLGILGALSASVQVWSLGLLLLPAVLLYIAMKQLKELQSHTHFMLESLADTVDLRDPYTGGHSQRVAVHTAEILKSLSLQGPEAEIVILSARLHDIGKIGVPDYVLNKPGRFTPDEEAIMRTHPDRGADLLKRYPDFARGADIIRHHHENWDGTGYPHGIKRTDIPFGSRVIAVADSYDAMTSDRPYRVAMTQAKATSILKDGRGKQWDPEIVDAFLRTLDMQSAPFESLPSQPIYAQPSGATRPAHA